MAQATKTLLFGYCGLAKDKPHQSIGPLIYTKQDETHKALHFNSNIAGITVRGSFIDRSRILPTSSFYLNPNASLMQASAYTTVGEGVNVGLRRVSGNIECP